MKKRTHVAEASGRAWIVLLIALLLLSIDNRRDPSYETGLEPKARRGVLRHQANAKAVAPEKAKPRRCQRE